MNTEYRHKQILINRLIDTRINIAVIESQYSMECIGMFELSDPKNTLVCSSISAAYHNNIEITN